MSPRTQNNPGHPVNWTITLANNLSYAGNKSAALHIDGLQDDGTIWIWRKLAIQSNMASNVSVSFQLWSPSESFNTIAVVVGHVGTKNATSEDDFQIFGAANQVEGWKNYTTSANIQTRADGAVYVALGISVRWETSMTYYIDDITVTESLDQ